MNTRTEGLLKDELERVFNNMFDAKPGERRTTQTDRDTKIRSFASPMSVQSFTDYRHEQLTRCNTCSLKYDFCQLQPRGHGYICKFCLKTQTESMI